MDEVIRTELLENLSKTIDILTEKESQDLEELKELSTKAINKVALYKNLDLISLTVLIYTIYKILPTLDNYQDLLRQLKAAFEQLQQNDLRKYNTSIQNLFKIITKYDAQVKVHLQDVMQAARIKKSADLLQKGLSVGQAAGLMGLSNWDLQQYVGKTIIAEHKEIIPVKKRLSLAFKLFGV